MRPVVLLLCAFAPLVRASDDRPKRRVPDAELQKKINAAIDKGVAYLKKVQRKDGSWPYERAAGPKSGELKDGTGGLTALALYAMAASGVQAKDKHVKRGVRWTEKHKTPFRAGATWGTYSASLLILALTRIDAKKHRDRIHRLAESLVYSQLKSDMWTYRLGGKRTSGGGKGRRGGGGGRPAGVRGGAGRGDNSNSQFAVLALWAAYAITGFDVPRATWERIRGFYGRTQLPDGGWSYLPAGGNRGATPSMTAAGLVSFVYATAALAGGPRMLPVARRDAVARKGLRTFLAKRGRAGMNFGAWSFRNYYFVYSLERVGTVLDVPEKEWYYNGARTLVRDQEKDGSWRAGRGHGDKQHVYNTSLALLFLSRATRYSLTPGGGKNERPLGPAPTTKRDTFPDPAQSGNLERAFEYYHVYKPDQRKKVAHQFGRAGPRAVDLFIRRLGDDDVRKRTTAYELLERLVEKKFFFEPNWPADDRALMLKPIREFWTAYGRSLRWDAGLRIFVVGDR